MATDSYAVGIPVEPPYFFREATGEVKKIAYDDPFNTEGWIDHCRRAARKLGIEQGHFLGERGCPRWKRAIGSVLSHARAPGRLARLLTSGAACPHYLQPVLAMIGDTYLRRGRVSVLDIGGGFGDNYFELLRALNCDMAGELQYDVVDNERSCALGAELFAEYELKPRFTSDYTVLTDFYDIVLLIGTLQYLPAWKQTLTSIAARARTYLFITRTPISSGTSFTATQLISPAFGSYAGRNLGATQVNVVGIEDLRRSMEAGLWRTMFEFMDTDCSSQFAKLPEHRRSVAYYAMGWQRPSDGRD